VSKSSAAFSNGNPSYAVNVPNDQRGFERVVNGRLDLGAYEVQLDELNKLHPHRVHFGTFPETVAVMANAVAGPSTVTAALLGPTAFPPQPTLPVQKFYLNNEADRESRHKLGTWFLPTWAERMSWRDIDDPVWAAASHDLGFFFPFFDFIFGNGASTSHNDLGPTAGKVTFIKKK